jgi:hypothetical protein
MQPESPGSDEQPTVFAELTIIKLPVPQGDPALEELPSRYAELAIIRMPLLPGEPEATF